MKLEIETRSEGTKNEMIEELRHITSEIEKGRRTGVGWSLTGEDDDLPDEKDVKTFKCPTCKKKLTRIGVVSKCHQLFYLEEGIYSSVQETEGGVIGFYCPECGNDIEIKDEKLLRTL